MKFNLENFPKKNDHGGYWGGEVDEWFEGIKKELREKYKRYNLETYAMYLKEGGVEDLIKEILGDA